jgi:hypothetical protein
MVSRQSEGPPENRIDESHGARKLDEDTPPPKLQRLDVELSAQGRRDLILLGIPLAPLSLVSVALFVYVEEEFEPPAWAVGLLVAAVVTMLALVITYFVRASNDRDDRLEHEDPGQGQSAVLDEPSSLAGSSRLPHALVPSTRHSERRARWRGQAMSELPSGAILSATCWSSVR